MNIDNWTKAFKKLGSELVEMKLPMKRMYGFEQGLAIVEDGLTIMEERHTEFKEMTIHSMYGKFYCPNPRCNSKRWNSTSCNTSMYYRYDDVQQCGEIIIESGMLRIIRICRHPGGQTPRRADAQAGRRPGGQLISYYILKLDW